MAVKTADKGGGLERNGGRSERRLSVSGRTRSTSVGGRRSSLVHSERPSRSMSRERSRSRLSVSDGQEKIVGRVRLSSRDLTEAKVVPPPTAPVVPQPVVVQPAVVQPEPPQEEDFDESDPIIYIPALSPDEELPPPPPRTEEEAERHAERLEMRRVHDSQDKKKSTKQRGENSKHNHQDVSPKHHEVKAQVVEPVVVHKTRVEPKAESNVMPSANAMALLESHGKEEDDEKHNKKSHKKHDDDASETSSISTASAKMYQLEPDEMHAKHPELAGVDPPNLAPPREIIPSRNRSISRPKKEVKKSVDPEEECNELVIYDPTEVKKPSKRRSSHRDTDKSRAKSSEDRRRKSSERRSRSVVVEEEPTAKSTIHGSKSIQLQSDQSRHRLSKSVPSAEITTLSASTARMSRQHRSHRDMSKSVGHRSKSRDGRTTAARSVAAQSRKSTRTRSTGRHRRSTSRSRKILDEATECCSRMSKSNKVSGARTTCTQPLSVSSDEIVKDKKEEEEPVVLYKKRARRKSEAASCAKSMPVAHIALSSDEKSHASSISSSSTIEESFAYSDDEKEGGVGDKSRKSGLQSARASMMLKDVKGSAVGLASRGRSTLIGLKGTSKKWQSALFM